MSFPTFRFPTALPLEASLQLLSLSFDLAFAGSESEGTADESMNRRQLHHRHRGTICVVAALLFLALWIMYVLHQLSFPGHWRTQVSHLRSTPRTSTELPTSEGYTISPPSTAQIRGRSAAPPPRDSIALQSSHADDRTGEWRMAGREADVRLVIFATLKPCTTDDIRLAQLDAVTTWLTQPFLRGGSRVALLGSGGSGSCAAWVASALPTAALRQRVTLVLTVEEGTHGTVLLGPAIRQVEGLFPDASVFGFINGDILLHPRAGYAIVTASIQMQHFFMIGHRTTISVPLSSRKSLGKQQDGVIDFASASWPSHDIFASKKSGDMQDRTDAEDMFFWTSGFLQKAGIEVPRFHIGRPAYDNWLVHRAIHSWMPVIDATEVLCAFHQHHGYGHLVPADVGLSAIAKQEKEGKKTYWGGEEQQENYALGIANGGWQHGLIEFAPLALMPTEACEAHSQSILEDPLVHQKEEDKEIGPELNLQWVAAAKTCHVDLKKTWKPFPENSIGAERLDFSLRYASFCRTEKLCFLKG
jgi:hypothetical protein